MVQGMLGDDTMSNLTSASNEASLSFSKNQEPYNNNSINHQAPPAKKKRNLPGNPDPEAEVVTLSPKTLMATNRFVCEICNKGFQRDQNLQLHRRGHNLPWKLKQRNKLEVVKKKVYVCPEPSCVHHHPSRALGDLTGIKKHFCRKHGEKKWKCEKCSKRYAVQSDWKAHSKICGTKEYRCDCGTLFSRRDSFITHRAFCDALAEESSRSNPLNLSSQTAPNIINHNQTHAFHQNHRHLIPPLKQETHNFNMIPPWLSSSEPGVAAGHGPGPGPGPGPPANQLFTLPTRLQQSIHESPSNPNNNNKQISMNALDSNSSSSLMSATALLQKAAQMGVTMSTKLAEEPIHHNNYHMGAGALGFCATTSPATTAGLPTREEFVHDLASFGGKVVMDLQDINRNVVGSNPLPCSTGGFMTSGSSAFNDGFNGMFNPKININSGFQENAHFMSLSKEDDGGGGGGGGGATVGNEFTRDFLGMRAFPRRDFMNMDQLGSSSYDQQTQNHTQWHSSYRSS